MRESTGGIFLGGGRMNKFLSGRRDSLHPASRENPSDLDLFCRGKNHFSDGGGGNSQRKILGEKTFSLIVLVGEPKFL